MKKNLIYVHVCQHTNRHPQNCDIGSACRSLVDHSLVRSYRVGRCLGVDELRRQHERNEILFAQ